MGATPECSAQYLTPERACYQQASVWWATRAEREGSSQENETDRSLPETPQASSKQAGAMGTNTRASIKRTSHTNIRGHTSERRGSRKHWQTSQMHGGSRGLEAPLEDSSEDDLERGGSRRDT